MRGWQVDSQTLRHGLGTRPEKGRNLAIAEWPTASGPADYAFFVGETLMALVEAKRKNKNVHSAVGQAERYARGVQWENGGKPAGGPWEEFQAPFAYAANGRDYNAQIKTESGIWFRDLRRPQNAKTALTDWHTPEGLTEKLEVDRAAAEADLEKRNFNFGFKLRPYQINAIKAVEKGLTDDQRLMLLAMATGTGKTKLAIALAYRMLDSKCFLRLCFIVDRSALGEQAFQAFDTTRMIGAKTFAEIFGLKGLGDRNIGRDVKVHICTIQSLVRRVLASAPEDRPPVDQYDLMIIDECHRGYLLDREMSEAEAAFRDEADYISKYRRVLEHFDATKIGLTATPALHTSEIFGQPIYRYGYREAVVDGWLIDHDPPHQIKTALSAAGITFEKGETVQVFNTETGEIDLAEMEDDLGFQVQHFNRKVMTPTFNKVVAEELACRIDPFFDGKTLIFAASDRHADQVVDALLKAYRDAGWETEDDMIRKITGSVDKVSDVIRSYKNDRFPNIAVTVDLLTTGIDVPKITNLVFLRRVNSRILYDQMIGRATRPCDEIGKEVFQIYDAVDLYPQLQNLTEMRPVVVSPTVTFEELFDGLERVDEEGHQEQIREQIAVKLSRKVRKIGEEQRRQYEAETGETPEETLARIRSASAAEVREWAREKPGIGAFFDFTGDGGAPPILPIAEHDDRVIAVTRGYGDGAKPEDFIESFSTFVRENWNKIAALSTVLTRPRDLTRSALKELRTELDRLHFTEPNLRSAWRESTNDDVAASIIGFIRQAAIGDPLVPYAERIDRATRAIAARRNLSSLQRRWLERIAEELKRQTLLDAEAFDEQPFAKDGGYRRFNKIFNGELEQLLIDIQDEAWNPAA